MPDGHSCLVVNVLDESKNPKSYCSRIGAYLPGTKSRTEANILIGSTYQHLVRVSFPNNVFS
jgi:hypothetical protein